MAKSLLIREWLCLVFPNCFSAICSPSPKTTQSSMNECRQFFSLSTLFPHIWIRDFADRKKLWGLYSWSSLSPWKEHFVMRVLMINEFVIHFRVLFSPTLHNLLFFSHTQKSKLERKITHPWMDECSLQRRWRRHQETENSRIDWVGCTLHINRI